MVNDMDSFWGDLAERLTQKMGYGDLVPSHAQAESQILPPSKLPDAEINRLMATTLSGKMGIWDLGAEDVAARPRSVAHSAKQSGIVGMLEVSPGTESTDAGTTRDGGQHTGGAENAQARGDEKR